MVFILRWGPGLWPSLAVSWWRRTPHTRGSSLVTSSTPLQAYPGAEGHRQAALITGHSSHTSNIQSAHDFHVHISGVPLPLPSPPPHTSPGTDLTSIQCLCTPSSENSRPPSPRWSRHVVVLDHACLLRVQACWDSAWLQLTWQSMGSDTANTTDPYIGIKFTSCYSSWKSTLVQVMAWYLYVTNHCLSQWWSLVPGNKYVPQQPSMNYQPYQLQASCVPVPAVVCVHVACVHAWCGLQKQPGAPQPYCRQADKLQTPTGKNFGKLQQEFPILKNRKYYDYCQSNYPESFPMNSSMNTGALPSCRQFNHKSMPKFLIILCLSALSLPHSSTWVLVSNQHRWLRFKIIKFWKIGFWMLEHAMSILSQYKGCLSRYPIIKVRWSHDNLILIMRIPMHVRQLLCIEGTLWGLAALPLVSARLRTPWNTQVNNEAATANPLPVQVVMTTRHHGNHSNPEWHSKLLPWHICLDFMRQYQQIALDCFNMKMLFDSN